MVMVIKYVKKEMLYLLDIVHTDIFINLSYYQLLSIANYGYSNTLKKEMLYLYLFIAYLFL